MIDLEQLTDIGRKQWTKRKYDEYLLTENKKAIDRAIMTYKDPTNKELECIMDKPKFKRTIDKKVNYLLARKPILTGHQDELDGLLDFIKESAKQYLLRGSLIWIVQGDGESIEPVPMIMNNTIAIYADENNEEVAAFIRKYTDIEMTPETGEEKEVDYYELYYAGKKDTFCYTKPNSDTIGETFDSTFIELGKTGDAPLFAYVERILLAFDHIMKHQDTTVEKNTKPLVEVRGYTGTDDADLENAVDNMSIIKVDGNGAVTIHSRSMDSTSIDLWAKRLAQEYYEATCTVGKENELAYAQSGKAMDRLFIDMENDARDLAHVLEEALKAYFEEIGILDADIVWNTDRPVDDTEIINGIAASTGILSQRTLLEQHPWVEDVDEELERLGEEGTSGFEDLVDTNFDEEE